MKNLSFRGALPRVLLVALASWTSLPGAAAGNATDASRQAAVDAVFADIRPGEPGVAVGIYQHGKLVLSRGYGSADLDHGVALTPDTVFNLASVSKQFTAFSIALLARDGKIDLQADMRKYLPGMPDLGAKITVSDLVHHLSGLRDYMALAMLSGHDDESLLRQRQAIALLQAQRALSHPPGTRYEYSNSGYAVLAEIVAAASGKPFGEFMQERIFRPLGMTHTRLHDSLNQIEPGYAVGYEQTDDGKWHRAVYNRVTQGPGNVLSTVGDLVKWIGNFANPAVGDAALVSKLAEPAALRDGTPVNYGFGLSKQTMIGHRTIQHTGGISGFSTVVVYFPDDDFGVVVLANRPFDADGTAARLAAIYLEARPEKETAEPRTARNDSESQKAAGQAVHPAAQLSQLAGRYRSDEIDTTYTLTVENGTATLRSLYLVGAQPLTPVSADRFEAKDGPLSGLEVGVERDEGGKPTALLFDYGRLHGLRFRRAN